ncbi:hypothetical protein L596_000140 [Steinernema carpocapsae]|uniref:Uncharacterized protein n=1 Tax=Steinernema carpocapsae TaxID=34508 RepID=A0A4U8UJN9_STECR|nr:hypothetical protein L596_000140 [Steinernema carpocapsae]
MDCTPYKFDETVGILLSDALSFDDREKLPKLWTAAFETVTKRLYSFSVVIKVEADEINYLINGGLLYQRDTCIWNANLALEDIVQLCRKGENFIKLGSIYISVYADFHDGCFTIRRNELFTRFFSFLSQFFSTDTLVYIDPQGAKPILPEIYNFLLADSVIKNYAVIFHTDVLPTETINFVGQKANQLKGLKLELLSGWTSDIWKSLETAFAAGNISFLTLHVPLCHLNNSQPVTMELIRPIFERWESNKGKEEIAFCANSRSSLLDDVRTFMNHLWMMERKVTTIQELNYTIFDYRLIDGVFDLIVSFDHSLRAISIFTRSASKTDRIDRFTLYWKSLNSYSFSKRHLHGLRL